MATRSLTPAAGAVHASLRASTLTRLVPGAAIAAVLLLAGFLNFYRLTELGYANQYYAAAVRSMLQNWHAFFFASFDAAGFVSVDKPPAGLWVQTLSARLFGFHGFTILLPQALAGVGSCAVVYLLVRRAFGTAAGLLAALMLALTPIAVATNRNNTMDSVLVFVLLLGAWAVLGAAETGRLRWLVLCAVLVGAGFNIKMLQAYLVVPAFFFVYLAAAPLRWWKRLAHLAAAGAVLAALSLSWAAVVDLTPAGQRPFVGSSSNNSAIDLIFGYNGIQRLTGLRFGRGRSPVPAVSTGIGPGGAPGTQPAGPAGSQVLPPRDGVDVAVDRQTGAPDAAAGQRPAAFPGGGGPGGFGETGAKGPLRLLNQQLGGQIGWLLPLALFGLVATWQWLPRRPLDRRHQSLLLWGGWLLTAGAFFSVAGFFHRYYLIMLGPPIAALAGAGVVAMWQAYRRPGPRGWLLPIALLATAAVQVYILASYPEWSHRLVRPVGAICLVAALALTVARLSPRLRNRLQPAAVLAAAVAALLITPAVWAGITVHDGGNLGLPAAGPASGGPFGGMGPPPFGVAPDRGINGGAQPGPQNARLIGGPGRGVNTALVDYLKAHRGDAEFLAATQSTMDAAPIIIATGEPVMALGGFSGGDPILTVEQLAEQVRNGRVRFFLLPPAPPGGVEGMQPPAGGAPFFGGPGGRQAATLQWVTEHCAPVPADAWQGTAAQASAPPAGAGGFPFAQGQRLYDCASPTP
jgi:4-amino-4-deoxy-L-arabinose transferase-like glycosyltransferase